MNIKLPDFIKNVFTSTTNIKPQQNDLAKLELQSQITLIRTIAEGNFIWYFEEIPHKSGNGHNERYMCFLENSKHTDIKKSIALLVDVIPTTLEEKTYYNYNNVTIYIKNIVSDKDTSSFNVEDDHEVFITDISIIKEFVLLIQKIKQSDSIKSIKELDLN